MGSGPDGRHRWTVPAGRTRSVRLPHRLLLAGAGAGSAEPRARLDGRVRGRAEGLAQDRSHLPVTTEARCMWTTIRNVAVAAGLVAGLASVALVALVAQKAPARVS